MYVCCTCAVLFFFVDFFWQIPSNLNPIFLSRKVLGFFSNTVIFVLAGLLVTNSLLDLWYNAADHWLTYAYVSLGLLAIYIGLHVIRASVVFAFWVINLNPYLKP